MDQDELREVMDAPDALSEARELARVTVILTDKGVVYDQATTDDTDVLLYLCEAAAHGIKQVRFTNLMAQKASMKEAVQRAQNQALTERLALDRQRGRR